MVFRRLRAFFTLLPDQVVATPGLGGEGLEQELAVVEVNHLFRSLAHTIYIRTVINGIGR